MAALQKVNAQDLPWDKFDVLSLDIFDTTLARLSGPPLTVFQLIESQLVSQYGDSFLGFASKRAEIDAIARKRAWERKKSEEIQLEDIYQSLDESGASLGLGVRTLCDLEESIERAVLYGLDPTRKLVAEARRRRKKVIFISDMYLSVAFIAEQLKRCGFSDYDHLFVSSEEGCLKWNGKLYKKVRDRLGLVPKRILHIGDNPGIDGDRAREQGWQSCLVPKPETQLEKLGAHPFSEPLAQGATPSENLVQSTLMSRHFDPVPTDGGGGFWFDFGYSYAAPLYFGMLRYILEKVAKRGLCHLYFLSRDGYFLKELYDSVAKSNPAYPKSKYLYASRRGLQFPAIERIDQSIENWLVEGIHLSVGDYFDRMGMNPERFSDHIRRYGFHDKNHIVHSGFEYDALRRLFREIEPAIVDSAKEERHAYLDYLNSMLGPDETFVMVDVGWNASLQKALKDIFRLGGIQRPVEGLYLGTYEGAESGLREGSSHSAYLLNYGKPESRLRLIRSGVALIEFLFAASETTFLRFQRDDAGGLRPVFHSDHENAKDLPNLNELQNGVRAFFARVGDLAAAPGLDLPAEAVERITRRWLTEPTMEEAEELSKIAYPDGWGAIFHHSKMADPSGFWRRISSPKKTKAHFKSSHWRPGYFALLGPLQRTILRLYHPAVRMDREL